MGNISISRYNPSDLAFIVPTKDRPLKVRALLQSLASQTVPCGRIIVVDGGESVESVVSSFSSSLPVEYYKAPAPGQLRQRNQGIALLDARTRLVGCLDDDIVLEKDAVESLIHFWNSRCEPETAGVSFNIVNEPSAECSWWKRVIGLGSPTPGQVLRSGITASNCRVSSHTRTQWLCGGATVWKQEILKEFPHKEINSRWAIGEDIIYSYPIGKQYPLYVCADAKVRHEHVFDYKVKRPHRFHGCTQTKWLFYFVESNKDLSRPLFLYTQAVKILGRIGLGLCTWRKEPLAFAMGQIEGLTAGLVALMQSRDLMTIINEGNHAR